MSVIAFPLSIVISNKSFSVFNIYNRNFYSMGFISNLGNFPVIRVG
jgi:hypothetical protein